MQPMSDSERYLVIDTETATADPDSCCQLGAVLVEDGEIVGEYVHKVRPPGNRYRKLNTRIHGIAPADTRDAPPFKAVWDDMLNELSPNVQPPMIVAHNTAFDIPVITHSHEYAGDDIGNLTWLCTREAARKAWPTAKSVSLKSLCEQHGIDITDHHDALADARAAAMLAQRIHETLAGDTSDSFAVAVSLHGIKQGKRRVQIDDRDREYFYTTPCTDEKSSTRSGRPSILTGITRFGIEKPGGWRPHHKPWWIARRVRNRLTDRRDARRSRARAASAQTPTTKASKTTTGVPATVPTAPAAASGTQLRCGHRLTNGRTCCHPVTRFSTTCAAGHRNSRRLR